MTTKHAPRGLAALLTAVTSQESAARAQELHRAHDAFWAAAGAEVGGSASEPTPEDVERFRQVLSTLDMTVADFRAAVASLRRVRQLEPAADREKAQVAAARCDAACRRDLARAANLRRQADETERRGRAHGDAGRDAWTSQKAAAVELAQAKAELRRSGCPLECSQDRMSPPVMVRALVDCFGGIPACRRKRGDVFAMTAESAEAAEGRLTEYVGETEPEPEPEPATAAS